MAKEAIFFEGKYDIIHLKEEIDKYDEVYKNYIKNRRPQVKDIIQYFWKIKPQVR